MDLSNSEDILGNGFTVKKVLSNRSPQTPVPWSLKELCAGSEMDLPDPNRGSHQQDMPQRSTEGACFVWTQFPSQHKPVFSPMCAQDEAVLQAFFRSKSWNNMSHLTDEANKQNLTAVTLSQIIRFFPFLISITHWHFILHQESEGKARHEVKMHWILVLS